MTKLSRLIESTERRARPGKTGGQHGFTLLELVVILLIVAVLLIVGIPTLLSYLAARSDADAQGSLQTALQGSDTYYNESFNTYSGLCSLSFPNCDNPPRAGFAGTDTGVNGVDAQIPSLNPQTVSIWVSPDGSEIVLVALSSSSDNCWGIVKATGNNVIFKKHAPATFFLVEKSKNHKSPGCYAANPIFRSPIPDVTRELPAPQWPATPAA